MASPAKAYVVDTLQAAKLLMQEAFRNIQIHLLPPTLDFHHFTKLHYFSDQTPPSDRCPVFPVI